MDSRPGLLWRSAYRLSLLDSLSIGLRPCCSPVWLVCTAWLSPEDCENGVLALLRLRHGVYGLAANPELSGFVTADSTTLPVDSSSGQHLLPGVEQSRSGGRSLADSWFRCVQRRFTSISRTSECKLLLLVALAMLEGIVIFPLLEGRMSHAIASLENSDGMKLPDVSPFFGQEC